MQDKFLFLMMTKTVKIMNNGMWDNIIEELWNMRRAKTVETNDIADEEITMRKMRPVGAK